ncbi:MAG: putative DNA-binding domain-containing protein [Hyphomicrobiales bacterium]|nr:putative DNA-binding domain-containing protein [Hyphomicrobiales bacterium]
MCAATAATLKDQQRDFASALLVPSSEPPSGLRSWNGSDPGQRFAVYRNNVIVNLVEGLCETFPVCHELVGDGFFRAMAARFVRAHPPSGPVLSEYGGALPDFIAAFEPAQEVPFLADVARLEWARVCAWHAADAQSLGSGCWTGINPDALSDIRLVPHPSACVLAFASAAVTIWAAHQTAPEDGAPDLAGIEPRISEACLVVRPGLDVEVLALPPGGAEFFQQLAAGQTVGWAANAAADSAPDFDLPGCFAVLVQSGFAIRFDNNERTPQ